MTDVDGIDPMVQLLVDAINDGDRDAFLGLLAEDATLSDDGTERDLQGWVDREIFTSNGHLEVVSVSDGGTTLLADYRNDTYGTMRTRWSFQVTGDRISRIEAGQA